MALQTYSTQSSDGQVSANSMVFLLHQVAEYTFRSFARTATPHSAGKRRYATSPALRALASALRAPHGFALPSAACSRGAEHTAVRCTAAKYPQRLWCADQRVTCLKRLHSWGGRRLREEARSPSLARPFPSQEFRSVRHGVRAEPHIRYPGAYPPGHRFPAHIGSARPKSEACASTEPRLGSASFGLEIGVAEANLEPRRVLCVHSAQHGRTLDGWDLDRLHLAETLLPGKAAEEPTKHVKTSSSPH